MTKLAFDLHEPCASCPYRRDARLAYWHEEEFHRLVLNDGDPIMGALYACHGTRRVEKKSVCGGWLLDQRDRGVPSIQLRLRLMRDEEAVECLETITDGGHERFGSIEEMVRANFPDRYDEWAAEARASAAAFQESMKTLGDSDDGVV